MTVTNGVLEDIDFEYAVSVAERAMQLMAVQRVPPTPRNFHLWFSYAFGAPSDLKRAMDILIANKRRFDAVANRDLFATYIASQGIDKRAISNASQQLHAVMEAARSFLNTAIADNRSQMHSIGQVADRGRAQIADPRTLIESLMKELEKATTRAVKLEARFSEKARELDTIRDTLSKSEERAKTDALTGLPNRRALNEFFRSAQIAAMEKGEPLSVLMLDIDHFKDFNDNFGHGAGDQVLRLMASVLREKIREGDLPARYGGEELIAVFPKADLNVCEAAAERIRRSIAERRITRRSTGEVLPQITVSIGVAQFLPGESMADLIDRCDRALYFAKRSGRNRVITEKRLGGDLVAS